MELLERRFSDDPALSLMHSTFEIRFVNGLAVTSAKNKVVFTDRMFVLRA